MGCTTLLVGKAASYNGSTIIARNEDSPNGSFTEKRWVARKPQGQKVYTSVITKQSYPLPERPAYSYTALPNADLKEGLWESAGFNECGVGMSATETLTSNSRVLGADPLMTQGLAGPNEQPAGIGEEDMVTLVLPYISSAREGVLYLGKLLETYGTYEMNGIAFSDQDEIWWLETVGGHHWIAKRVPDDAYVVVPNQLGIDSFDLDDAEGEARNHLASKDLRTWMDTHHLNLDGSSRFNPRHAFGSASDMDHVYNTPRAWDIVRHLSPEIIVENDLGPESDTLPWAASCKRKLTIEDVKYCLSMHYQGTVFDPFGTKGSDAQKKMYRSIGINRNCQLAILEARPEGAAVAGLPAAALNLCWLSFGSNAFNATCPFYSYVATTPAYLSDCDPNTVDSNNFYWANRLIAALADKAYAECGAALDAYSLRVASKGRAIVEKWDKVLAQDTPQNEAVLRERLAEANMEIAAMLKLETDACLKAVLHISSLRMHNAFNRSDA